MGAAGEDEEKAGEGYWGFAWDEEGCWSTSTSKRSTVMLFWMKVWIVLKSARDKSSISSALFCAFYTCFKMHLPFALTF